MNLTKHEIDILYRSLEAMIMHMKVYGFNAETTKCMRDYNDLQNKLYEAMHE